MSIVRTTNIESLDARKRQLRFFRHLNLYIDVCRKKETELCDLQNGREEREFDRGRQRKHLLTASIGGQMEKQLATTTYEEQHPIEECDVS